MDITEGDINKMIARNNPAARSWKEERKHMELVERGVLKDTSPGAVEARLRLSAYDNEVFDITIDPEFAALIPPPTDEERAALEAELLAHGCLDALKVWRQENILLDGHNRIRICRTHGLEYAVEYLDFDSREDALLWMIDSQLGRRNLTGFQRAELSDLKLPLIAAKAKANQAHGQTAPGKTLHQNSDEALEPINTLREIAKDAGVSHDTQHKVRVIKRDAPTPIVEKARSGDLSVDRAYKLTRVLQDAPARVVELITRLELDSADKVDILKRLHESSGVEGSNDTFGEVEKSGGFHYGDTLEQWCNVAVDGVETIHKALRSLAYTHALVNGQTKDALREQILADDDPGDGDGRPMKPKLNRAANEYVPQGYDACHTPPYALTPLLPFLRPDMTIWDPPLEKHSLVNALRAAGMNNVIATDILTGENFFDYAPESFDILLTNPPYSLKYRWLERCYALGKPFALLLPVEILGAQSAQKLLKPHGFEMLLLDRRVNFKMPNKGWAGSAAQFPTMWLTWNLLPQQVVFGSIRYGDDGDV